MTAVNKPQKSPLKVVPPKSPNPAPIGTPTPPPAQKTPTTPEPTKSSPAPKADGKWFIMALMVVGVGAIAAMPFTNYVRGEAEITDQEGARERITIPISGMVKIKVKTNQVVAARDVVAEVTSAEIENQIADAERQRQQAVASLAAAENYLPIAEKQLEEAETAEAIARSRADKQQQEIQAIISGENLPKIRELEREIEIIEQEIASIHNNDIRRIQIEIVSIQKEIEGIEINTSRLSEQLKEVEKRLSKLQGLAADGLFPSEDPRILELNNQKTSLTSQIEQQTISQIPVKRQEILAKESEIRQSESLIEQKYQLIAAKREQIQEVEKQVRDLSDERENDIEQQVAARRRAEEELEAARGKVESEKQLLTEAEGELQRLETRMKTDLILRTPVGGTVLTQNLDLLNNTTIQAGQEILRIADLRQLPAEVKIAQEDANLINTGQIAIFKLRGSSSSEYQAIVQEKTSVIDTDESGRPRLTVKISIKNQENQLLPGTAGYVHIATGEMRVYQKVWLEVNKVLNLGKYLPW
ncbi:HlyD family secretion protein [[Phormidium] sp. ETS-05]|uniref:HlyD family secretion protein n=1 Tax=[Phormidium] sp. ETS-05 TaxID=222819 RepID=UPI0018EECD0C|nr:HlyD family secretion protein [[Phormidium] sp. ETS-05]